MKEENYLDSRTKEEREKDSKIESITTTSEQLKQKMIEEFNKEFSEDIKIYGYHLLSLEKAVREETIKECIEAKPKSEMILKGQQSLEVYENALGFNSALREWEQKLLDLTK
jgi:hypothetical protein